MAGTVDRVVTSVATQLMLATPYTADELSENAWLRGAYRVGQGDAMTSGRSVPCRSFTKVHAVSELTFLASQISRQTSAHKGNDRGVRDFRSHPSRCAPVTLVPAKEQDAHRGLG
jgi:hypothetical protein